MSLSGAILASGAGALVFIPFSLKRPVTLLIASVAPTRGNFESGYFSEYHVHLPVSALTPIVDITFPRRSTTGTTYSEGLPDSECKRSGSPATAPYHAGTAPGSAGFALVTLQTFWMSLSASTRAGSTVIPPPPPAHANDVNESSMNLSLIHISEPTRLGMISYAVF